MADAVVRGLGLRDGDVAAPPGDGDGVRTSGDNGLLCHDLRRLPPPGAAVPPAAGPRVTDSLWCFSPCSELGRPPTVMGEDPAATAGDPGALEPGELLCDDECAESEVVQCSVVDGRRGTTVVGEPGTLSLDERDL